MPTPSPANLSKIILSNDPKVFFTFFQKYSHKKLREPVTNYFTEIWSTTIPLPHWILFRAILEVSVIRHVVWYGNDYWSLHAHIYRLQLPGNIHFYFESLFLFVFLLVGVFWCSYVCVFAFLCLFFGWKQSWRMILIHRVPGRSW